MDQETGAKPTLKTIAKMTGLAVPTVSRALHDAPDIGARTKALVRKTADDIGYIPNRAGVRLRTGRTNVISLVLSTAHDMTNHTGALISAIAGEMQGTVFHMNVTPYFPHDDTMKPIRHIVENRLADAVILNQIEPEDPRVKYLLERSFPFATHGRDKDCDSHPYYDYDNAIVGRVAVEKLAARKRHRLLLIAPPRAQAYALHTIAGAQETAATLGLQLILPDALTSDMPRGDLVAGVAQYLRDDPSIDGIICSSTSAAMGAVAGLESIGRTLTGDIDVFAKEAVPILEWFRPGILSVSEDVAVAGRFLARAAMQAVEAPEKPPMQFLEVPKL